MFKLFEDYQIALEASNMFKEQVEKKGFLCLFLKCPNKMNISLFCGSKWPVSTFMAKHKREKTENYLGIVKFL